MSHRRDQPNVRQGPHPGPVIDTTGPFDVVECRSCGYRHIVPLPAPESAEALYRERYYSEEKPRCIEHQSEDSEWWRMVHAERFEILESLVAPDHRRVLDVGAGPGWFLATGAARNWQTVGIEPAHQAAAHARGLGLEIHEATVADLDMPSLGWFGVVHLSEVLEHVPEPRPLLATVLTVLRPGGILVACVPNDYNPLQHYLRAKEGYVPYWLAPPHHVNYFTPASLGTLLAGLGLEILHQEATFPMEFFLLMGERYVGDPQVGRRCHRMRKRFDLALAAGLPAFKRRLYEFLARESVGREIVMYARKPRD